MSTDIVETGSLDTTLVPVRSIVSDECVLRENHKGLLVTYKGVTGHLIRYRVHCEHELLGLTMAEARECVELNTPSEEVI
jgi:hypothetical protein